jgi:hypothetical protein
MSQPLPCRSQNDINGTDRGNVDCKYKGSNAESKTLNYVSGLASVSSDTLDASEVVIWPALLRVVDSEGVRVAEGNRELTEKVTLSCFATEV